MSFSFRHGDVAVHVTVGREAGTHAGCRPPGEPVLYPAAHADLVLPLTDPGDVELVHRPGLGSWRSGLSEGEFARFAGIPYGVLGRHLVMFLCTEAFRVRSRAVTLQPHRLYAFLAGLGSLSERTIRGGWFTDLEGQLHRTLRHGWISEHPGTAGTLVGNRGRPGRGFLDSAADHPPVITLDAEFARSALHWVRLDSDVVRLLSGRSCPALDVYIWLALVATGPEQPRRFTWPDLTSRFAGAADPDGFRPHFEACLEEVRRVTAVPPVSVGDSGVEIHPAAPCTGPLPPVTPC